MKKSQFQREAYYHVYASILAGLATRVYVDILSIIFGIGL